MESTYSRRQGEYIWQIMRYKTDFAILVKDGYLKCLEILLNVSLIN